MELVTERHPVGRRTPQRHGTGSPCEMQATSRLTRID